LETTIFRCYVSFRDGNIIGDMDHLWICSRKNPTGTTVLPRSQGIEEICGTADAGSELCDLVEKGIGGLVGFWLWGFGCWLDNWILEVQFSEC